MICCEEDFSELDDVRVMKAQALIQDLSSHNLYAAEPSKWSQAVQHSGTDNQKSSVRLVMLLNWPNCRFWTDKQKSMWLIVVADCCKLWGTAFVDKHTLHNLAIGWNAQSGVQCGWNNVKSVLLPRYTQASKEVQCMLLQAHELAEAGENHLFEPLGMNLIATWLP